ncbi:MAG: hypothetical protein R2705_24785 [Ilumatobacteraceae bacterium]
MQLNVTVVGAPGDGYITVYPCGTARPNASNVNYALNDTVANAVLTKVGPGGKVCFYSYAGRPARRRLGLLPDRFGVHAAGHSVSPARDPRRRLQAPATARATRELPSPTAPPTSSRSLVAPGWGRPRRSH